MRNGFLILPAWKRVFTAIVQFEQVTEGKEMNLKYWSH